MLGAFGASELPSTLPAAAPTLATTTAVPVTTTTSNSAWSDESAAAFWATATLPTVNPTVSVVSTTFVTLEDQTSAPQPEFLTPEVRII